MTVQDIIDELNDHGFTDTSTARKVALINDTVWDICSREPWPFLEESIDLTFDGSSAIPTNWPTDFRAALVLVDPSNGSLLEPKRLDALEKESAEDIDTVDTPTAYYFVGNQLRLFPVPNDGTTIRMRYLRLHPTLTSSSGAADILIPAQHHRAISLGALYKLYDMEDDFDISQRFQGEYESRLASMRSELWMRQYDRPDRIFDVDTEMLEFLG